jgi:hypothetical protein
MSKELVPTTTPQQSQTLVARSPLPPAPAPTPSNSNVRPLHQR